MEERRVQNSNVRQRATGTPIIEDVLDTVQHEAVENYTPLLDRISVLA